MSVNLPHCHLDYEPGSHRLMHIHHNVPGILRAINDILADRGINIERQVLDTQRKSRLRDIRHQPGLRRGVARKTARAFRTRFECACRAGSQIEIEATCRPTAANLCERRSVVILDSCSTLAFNMQSFAFRCPMNQFDCSSSIDYCSRRCSVVRSTERLVVCAGRQPLSSLAAVGKPQSQFLKIKNLRETDVKILRLCAQYMCLHDPALDCRNHARQRANAGHHLAL